MVTRVAHKVRQERTVTVVVSHAAEHARRSVLGFGQAFGQREDVFREANGLQHDLITLAIVGDVEALGLFGEELLNERLDNWQTQDLVAIGPVAGTGLEHELNHGSHLLGEVLGDAWVLALDDLLVKALHVVSPEGRHQGAHLVQDAAEGPDVGL